VIKLDVRQILRGQPRMLTCDLFAVVNLLVKDTVHAGYWLNLWVKGKHWTGQMENWTHYWASWIKLTRRPKM